MAAMEVLASRVRGSLFDRLTLWSETIPPMGQPHASSDFNRPVRICKAANGNTMF
jgi:hypothetical protein